MTIPNTSKERIEREKIYQKAYNKVYRETDKYKAYQKEYHKTDKFKKYWSLWTKNNRSRYLELRKKGQAIFNQLNPHRQKIYNLVNKTFGTNHFGLCAWCGEEKRLHLHHHDYRKPLEVMPLCVACHKKIHYAEK